MPKTNSRGRALLSFFLVAGFCAAGAERLFAESPLIEAVQSGDATAVRSVLKVGGDTNQPGADGSTPLMLAVHQENSEITDLLLAAGAKPDATSRYRVTPLAVAAETGNATILERLLAAGADANGVSEEGQTALMTAARNGKTDVVRVLIRHGAKVNAAESFKGQTPLMFAAGEGNTAAAEMLIEFGADLRARSKSGFTPLLFAVRNNRYETAKFLLAHGANPNDSIPGANSGPATAAINIAVLNADFDLASLLLDAGANPNVRDARGYPIHVVVWLHKPGAPPDFAMSGVDPQPVALPSGRMSHVDMLKKLLAKGADPNATVVSEEGRFAPGGGLSRNPPDLAIGRHYLTYMGATPFYLAARNGDAEMMRILAGAGANPTRPTKYGVTPLMGAACLDYYEGESPGPFSGVSETERLEAVKLALELGNDINARTHFGDYPMTGSPEDTLLRYPDNIKDILNLGVGDMRFDGMTALHGAVICNQPAIVEYLIQQGAKVDAKNRLGWTPLMVAGGIYIANNRKDFPVAAGILRKAMSANAQPSK
jgi:ankyrin repeat protein